MYERRIPLYRLQFPTRHDKAVRAQSIRGRMRQGRVDVSTKAPWYAAFQQELLTFPMARHDDSVDALGLIGQLLTISCRDNDQLKNTTSGIRQGSLSDSRQTSDIMAYAMGGESAALNWGEMALTILPHLTGKHTER